MTEGGPVVEATGVSKRFGEVAALEDIDLVIGPGTIHGLLGPNGAGKTTLLSALFGLVLPDGGTLRLFGRTQAEAGAQWLDGVGGFIETPCFYPYLSARANLLTLAALDGGDARLLVDDLLDLVGLSRARTRKVRGFSLGMRQRLGLAAALLRRPRLLILDEPTNGMDPAGVRDLRGALRQLARRGLTVVLASHDMVQVEDLCDSVTVLFGGRVAFAGSLDRMRAGAPDPAWKMRTSDDVAALAVADVFDEVKAIESETEPGLTVMAAQPELDTYVIELGRRGVAVRNLVLDVTPLEALFFHLTGTEGAA